MYQEGMLVALMHMGRLFTMSRARARGHVSSPRTRLTDMSLGYAAGARRAHPLVCYGGNQSAPRAKECHNVCTSFLYIVYTNQHPDTNIFNKGLLKKTRLRSSCGLCTIHNASLTIASFHGSTGQCICTPIFVTGHCNDRL